MTKILGEGLAKIGELAVRIAVQSRGGCCHGLRNRRLNIGGDAMGVFVNVEQNGDIKLRCAVGAQSTQVGPEG
ncbi:hypothetical protein StoSoilB3_15480 [Arthrobacter sp. StoSoilB3]|nr:hypothetical protein StoSoilB3_15480 [Arthrobacter sp. StoSoilB3]